MKDWFFLGGEMIELQLRGVVVVKITTSKNPQHILYERHAQKLLHASFYDTSFSSVKKC